MSGLDNKCCMGRSCFEIKMTWARNCKGSVLVKVLKMKGTPIIKGGERGQIEVGVLYRREL